MGAERIEGREAWQQALAALLAQPGSSLALYSPDYADWALNRTELVLGLDAWVADRRQPCVRVLAGSFEVIERDHPRFAAWCQRYSHLVQCHLVGEGTQLPPECLLAGDHGLLALPADHGRLAVPCEGPGWRDALETFDMAWERSTPGRVGASLGL